MGDDSTARKISVRIAFTADEMRDLRKLTADLDDKPTGYVRSLVMKAIEDYRRTPKK